MDFNFVRRNINPIRIIRHITSRSTLMPPYRDGTSATAKRYVVLNIKKLGIKSGEHGHLNKSDISDLPNQRNLKNQIAKPANNHKHSKH